MATVTKPIMLDETGQQIAEKLEEIAAKIGTGSGTGGGTVTADIQIGTVTSGDTASAEIVNGRLNLVLPRGEKGATGATGAAGATGAKGDKGDKGDTGAAGAAGAKGEKGDPGATGAKGDKGDKGDTGATGAKGDKGDKGETGPQGPAGDAGTAAAAPTYTPSRLGCVKCETVPGCDYAQIIIYGQSLASGTESGVARTDTALDGVYMVGSDAHWYKAQTLTGLNPCKNAGYESPIVAAVNHFATMYRRYKDPSQRFIANSTGLGGRSIERLSKGCTSYRYEYLYKDAFLDYLDKTKEAVDAEGKTVKCVAVVWMQGEYNYDGHNKEQGFTNGTDATTDKDEYKQYLIQLKKDMQADIMEKYGQSEPPLFFVYQTGGAFITNSTSSINMAQQEVAEECEDVVLLGSAMPCPRFAGGHMSSNGYRWQGEMIGKQLTESLIWGNAAHTVLDRNITVDGNKIYIDYEVPVPPLVADTYTVQEQPNYGFLVYVDDVGIAIEKAEIQNTRVVLTCVQELHGKIAVKYAGNAVGDRNHRGIGNLRDSDRYTSLYTYADDTAETSTAGNAIDYRPKDATGNSLNGKHYPMWNWASHAYREVIVDAIVATDFAPKLSGTKANVGDVLTLSWSYMPTNANSGTRVSWRVSDQEKAKIENGKVKILGGSNNDTVTITGTLDNGVQHSVTVTIVVNENPYASYYAYWDFTNGDASNTTTVRNLVTNAEDNLLSGVDGSTSGYLTTEGLTLGSGTAVKVPITSDMPDGMEIGMEINMPSSAYNYDGMRYKSFVSLVNGSKDEFEFGSEKYGYAWPEIRGVCEGGGSGGASWRGATDAGGTSLGNTAMWWSGSTMHQHVRIRLNTSGGGEVAMRADTDKDWRTWKLPTYAGANYKFPGFKSIKGACDAILFGNRGALNGAIPGAVLYNAYIKEYNG